MIDRISLKIPSYTAIVSSIALLVLFAVAEAISTLFIPPGPRFLHPQMLTSPHPTRIYDHVTNQRSYTMDKLFLTNRFGLRDSRYLPLDERHFRILSLGDSVAVGLGVAEETTYARLLEAALLSEHHLKTRVLNAAVGGYSTWMEIDLLKDKGLSMRPGVVLLSFFWNDIRPKPEKITPPAPQYTDTEETLYLLRLLKRSRILSLLRERWNSLLGAVVPNSEWIHRDMIYSGLSNDYVEAGYAQIENSLKEFKLLADRNAFIPVVLILPMPRQVQQTNPSIAMQERITTIVRNLELRYIDALPAMQRAYTSSRDLYIPWDNAHLTERGHQVIAEVLLAYFLGDASMLTNVRRQ